MRGLFITGTDTGVGKTTVTALLARQLSGEGVRVGAYKPVCTGAVCDDRGAARWSDIDILGDALGGRFPAERICPQRFLAPLAPPVAADREGRTVDAAALSAGVAWWRDHADLLLIEGVGGLLCPLTADQTVADFAASCGFPLLIVAAQRLGMINHTLLTVEVARRRGLPVAGLVVNEPAEAIDPSRETNLCATNAQQRNLSKRNLHETNLSERNLHETNLEQIAAHCDVPILATVPHAETQRLHPLPPAERIDWTRLAQNATRGERATSLLRSVADSDSRPSGD